MCVAGQNENTSKVLERQRRRTFQSKNKSLPVGNQLKGHCIECFGEPNNPTILHYCVGMDDEYIRVWDDEHLVSIECYHDANKVYPRPSYKDYWQYGTPLVHRLGNLGKKNWLVCDINANNFSFHMKQQK